MDDAIRKGLEADDAMGQDAAEPLRTRIAQLEAELAQAKGRSPAAPEREAMPERVRLYSRGHEHWWSATDLPPEHEGPKYSGPCLGEYVAAAALAAATARADEDEAGRLRWEQEAERLRGERADLQHKLAHWQRVAEESGTMVARRVEAMREAAAVHTQEYLVSCGVTDACDVAEEVADAIRALPAPSPGPSAEDALREWLDRDAWSFLRRLLEQGRAIEQDNQAGRYPTYEHLSARLDEAARERRVELIAALGRKGEA